MPFLVRSEKRPLPGRFVLPALAACSGLLFAGSEGGDYGPLPPVGSSNISIADPVVKRPSTTPCEIVLLDDMTFDDYSPRPYTFAPPPGCPAPWSKVVLTLDASVTAGIQYDRTGSLWMGGVNIYFGTTSEPATNYSPSWHVERDLTDYTALFTSPQSGQALIGNTVNAQYTGVIHGTATLQFYPVSAADPAPVVPDRVIPLGSDPVGATVDLADATQTLGQPLALPTNIERAYVDLVAESQGGDEFWWSCMPDDVAAITGDCPGTAFREVELGVDGQPAAVAPIYPWVYTGGVQPNLWIPTPGLQTLNFRAWRANLTPFAGVLGDGAPHTVSLGVYNAHDHFATTATLLLYLDAGITQVGGGVTTNTIAPPAPVVTSTFDADGIGTATVASNRRFTVAGYVLTSHGRVDTSIEQTFAFETTTTYPDASTETLTQRTTVDTTTTVTEADGGAVTRTDEHVAYPFSFDYLGSPGIDFDQRLVHNLATTVAGAAGFASRLSDHVATHYQGAAASRHGQQEYDYSDSTGACYSRAITSAANKLATVVDGASCEVLADTIFGDGFDGVN